MTSRSHRVLLNVAVPHRTPASILRATLPVISWESVAERNWLGTRWGPLGGHRHAEPPEDTGCQRQPVKGPPTCLFATSAQVAGSAPFTPESDS